MHRPWVASVGVPNLYDVVLAATCQDAPRSSVRHGRRKGEAHHGAVVQHLILPLEGINEVAFIGVNLIHRDALRRAANRDPTMLEVHCLDRAADLLRVIPALVIVVGRPYRGECVLGVATLESLRVDDEDLRILLRASDDGQKHGITLVLDFDCVKYEAIDLEPILGWLLRRFIRWRLRLLLREPRRQWELRSCDLLASPQRATLHRLAILA